MTNISDLIGENTYRAFENSTSYYAIAVDTEGFYLYTNLLFRERFSALCPTFEGQQSILSIHPEDIGKCEAAAKECFAHPTSVVPVQLRKPDALASHFWTHWDFSALMEDGKPVGVLCIGYDITERDVVGKKIMSYARRIKTILDNVTDGFYTLDNNWCFTAVNKVFEEFSGRTRQSLIGSSIQEVFPAGENYQYMPKYREALQLQESVHFEEYYPSKKKWYSISAYPSAEGLAVFFQDITLSKQNAFALAERNRILMDVAHMQSHDIRRPVATMLGLLQLIDKAAMSEENRMWFELFEKTAKELDEVIHKIVHKISEL